MTLSTPPKIYRIFPTYITYEGIVIHSGEYSEVEINIDEARLKSTAILVNASDFSSIKDLTSTPNRVLNNTGDFDRTLNATITKVEVSKLKINTCSSKAIEDLKFVGRITAQKILEARKDDKISTYAQLDIIAPLKNNKVWQDISVIDFELPEPIKESLYLKTFGHIADATS